MIISDGQIAIILLIAAIVGVFALRLGRYLYIR